MFSSHSGFYFAEVSPGNFDRGWLLFTQMLGARLFQIKLSFLSFRLFAYTLLVVHSESKHRTHKMTSSPKGFE